MLTQKPSKCQHCGRVADVADVTFRQNIGMLFMRRSKTLSGNFCKQCINDLFFSYTLTTLILGWWGTISFFLTPIFIAQNIGALTASFKLTPAKGKAKEIPNVPIQPKKLTPKLMDKIEPHTNEIITRLRAKEPLDQVANNIAFKASVTPEEVKLYVSELARVARKKQQAN